MPVRLIVNADDYGLTPGVSQGIRQAHLQGIVTSTTAMMNAPGAEMALHQALEACPRLGLGVHLTLTSGAPVLPAGQVPGLTGGKDQFLHREDVFQQPAQIPADELRAEWQAQVERFVAATGRRPDHLDSHHHVAYISPVLLRVMLELARAYEAAVRMPLHTWGDRAVSGLPLALLPWILDFAPPLMEAFAPRCPDYFSAGFYGSGADETGLQRLLDQLPEGATEIMCHPGQVDAALAATSSYRQEREDELAVLTRAGLRAALEARGVELITFAQLRA